MADDVILDEVEVVVKGDNEPNTGNVAVKPGFKSPPPQQTLSTSAVTSSLATRRIAPAPAPRYRLVLAPQQGMPLTLATPPRQLLLLSSSSSAPSSLSRSTSGPPIRPKPLQQQQQQQVRVVRLQQPTSFVPIAPSPSTITKPAAVVAPSTAPPVIELDSKRRPCNCTKSQCLKLYCDCFANGEFCSSCNCCNCFNNLQHEEERTRAVRQCLERNPAAFHPKIGADAARSRRHTKGCNCRRSGCLKNYCECYEARILCTTRCKCCGCKNYEDSCERKTLAHLADAAAQQQAKQSIVACSAANATPDFRRRLPVMLGSGGSRHNERLPCAFITRRVLDATSQCVLAAAENGERSNMSQEDVERMIVEEFGRCLRQVIDSANRTRAAKLANPST